MSQLKKLNSESILLSWWLHQMFIWELRFLKISTIRWERFQTYISIQEYDFWKIMTCFRLANYCLLLRGNMVTLYLIKTYMAFPSLSARNLDSHKKDSKMATLRERLLLRRGHLRGRTKHFWRRVSMETEGKKQLIPRMKLIKPLKSRRKMKELLIL